VTKREVERWTPLPVPVSDNLGVDYNWFGFEADPHGISVGLIGLHKFSIEYICEALMHEYTHMALYKIAGEEASTCLDNLRVHRFLGEDRYDEERVQVISQLVKEGILPPHWLKSSKNESKEKENGSAGTRRVSE